MASMGWWWFDGWVLLETMIGSGMDSQRLSSLQVPR